jgi:4-hydroxy-tetrahydrodipicolinate reductase
VKVALIGTGNMGRFVGELAADRGHEVAVAIDEREAGLSADELAGKLKGCDVAIDFSTAGAVPRNVEACMLAGTSMVEGTTGWTDKREEIERLIKQHNGAFVYGANFSIGVNLFYRIADRAAELFSKFPDYEAFIEEQHHSRKKDAPSGTALKLRNIIAKSVDRELSIASTRAGSIPGTHRVGFDGPADQVQLEHSARSREGFALGALLAAEWIIGKKGFHEFDEVISEKLS